MSAPTPAPSRSTEPDHASPPWSLGEVGIGVLAMLFLSSLAASVVFAVAGIDADERDDASMLVVALGSAGLWLSMALVVLVVCARHRVNGRSRRCGCGSGPSTCPFGIVVGVACAAGAGPGGLVAVAAAAGGPGPRPR